jgi:hypothetical protein
MLVNAEGWRRNHGSKEIMAADLVALAPDERETIHLPYNHPYNRPIFKVTREKAVSIYERVNLRMGGDYWVHLSLEKHEIARLFYLTHREELDGVLCTLGPFRDSEPKAGFDSG